MKEKLLLSSIIVLMVFIICSCGNKENQTKVDESLENAPSTVIQEESVTDSSIEVSSNSSIDRTNQILQSSDTSILIPENVVDNKKDKTDIKAEDVTDYLETGFLVMSEESLGEIKYGLEDTEIINLIGEPEEKSEAIVWGADDMEHQTWIYNAKGIELDMIRDGDSQKVDMITAQYPCDLKTKQNIRIGSSKEEVTSAYNNLINPEEVDQEYVVVGTIYGGMIFKFENDSVIRIFIGASAD